MLKRTFDLALATLLLLALSPLILVVSVLIWAQDFHGPFYVGRRVARGGGTFGMVKFRSMRVNADRTGVMSTAGDDPRITRVGAFVRRFKLDEIPQLFNIVKGDMSFVGPRPNVPTEVALYSSVEQRLVAARPGITDYASIVFADEGDVLHGSADPDRDYNLLIRPWKSRLSLHYLATASLGTDLRLVVLTALALASRERALAGVAAMLERSGAEPALVEAARRAAPLVPTLPPGVEEADWEAHLTYPGPARTG